jgi:protein TonB
LVVAFALGVTAIVAIGGAYQWMNERRMSAGSNFQAEPPKTSLPHFSASRDGSGWKLTWDAAVVEAMQPTAGILSIQDGTAQQEIPLTRADLSSGTIYYSPTTAELAFGIQFLKDGIVLAAQRIRVLGEIKALNKPPDQFERTRPGEQDRLPEPTSPQVPHSGGNFVPTTPPPSAAEPVVKNAVVRTFSPPISREPSKELAVISTTAAPLEVAAAPAVPMVELEATFAPPPTPSPSMPALTPAPATSEASTPAPLPTSSPTLPPVQSTPIGPKLIKQFQPTGSDIVGMHGSVELRVAISAKGKVTSVTPVGGIRNFQLTTAAIKAVEFWEFEPAKLHGKAVPSEINLIVHF